MVMSLTFEMAITQGVLLQSLKFFQKCSEALHARAWFEIAESLGMDLLLGTSYMTSLSVTSSQTNVSLCQYTPARRDSHDSTNSHVAPRRWRP